MPLRHDFAIDTTYQQHLEALEQALQSELAITQKSHWLSTVKQQASTTDSYFSTKQIKQRSTVWTLLLYVALKLDDYHDSVLESQEKERLDKIHALLVKLWNNTSGFNKDDGEAITKALNAWLSTNCFTGDDKTRCEFLAAYGLLAYALNTLVSSLSRLEKYAVPTSMLKLFEAMICLSDDVDKAFNTLISEKPHLNIPKERVVTSENAGKILAEEVKLAVEQVDAEGRQLCQQAISISNQLSLIQQIHQHFKEHDSDGVTEFFKSIDSEEKLITYLNALAVPETRQQAWLATYQSYVDGSYSSKAWYLWQGERVTRSKIQELLATSLQRHLSLLQIDSPDDCESIDDKIRLLNSSLKSQRYFMPVQRKRSHLIHIIEACQSFSYAPPKTFIHKQQRLSFHLSNKSAIKKRLSVITCELESSQKQLQQILGRLIAWRRQTGRLIKLINEPMLENIDTAHWLAIINQSILSVEHELSDGRDFECPIAHLDEMIASFEEKIKATAENIEMFKTQFQMLVALNSLNLQHLVCFMAVIDEEEMASISQSFSAIRAKIFYCVENAWDEEKQSFKDLSVVYQSLSRELKKQSTQSTTSFTKERMIFFAEKLTHHNQAQTRERSITKGRSASI